MKYLYGIQPTGRIHLGNYLGGLKEAISLSEEGHEVEIMIALFHAMTTTDDKKIEEMVLNISEHIPQECWALQKPQSPDFSWKIQCITPMSDLKRMTQFKDKGEGNVGLFTYPCLMAADIILADPDYVIIGEDQLQHMEFYRRTCKRLGIKRVAKNYLTETPRIMSIKDPTKKMSKSLGDTHCLYLGDHEENRKKIMKAPTTPEGIENLKQIAKGLGVEYQESMKKFKEAIICALSKI